MKKLLSVLSVCCLVIACQSEPKQETADKPANKPKTEVKKETPKPQAPPVNSEQAKVDDDLIKNYLADNGIKASKTPEGVYYIITKEGDGTHPSLDDYVQCHYKGYLLDGSEFDSSYSRNQPATFPLKGVVRGWQIGIPKISKGGKATLFIPSSLGYGPRKIGDKIPANSVLLFDVELLDIQTK